MDNDEEINPTQSEAKIIQAINKDTVHRICSGQVVLSLSIAMKELVENSIDAEATIIDVHLKEYGSNLIEVSDNGTGVIKENFQSLTLKHYTSKIKEFSDLENIATLGFRGEALSSLCALSDLAIITRHKDASTATKIIYDKNGKIVSESPIARQTGTTVILENLFSTLPVRKKEFLKNLKREFSKMCQLLYAYCLVSKGIKFNCTNLTEKGSKITVVATEGKHTVRENIISIFGARQISSLIDIELVIPDQSIQDEYGIKITNEDEIPFGYEFLISSVQHGSGRSSTDRQFYFINSRPCEPTKVMKLVNDIYRQFNGNQYPFVYLNITTKNSLVDVNVTPDKRQIFLEKEKVLLGCIKSSLLEIFKTLPSSYKMQNLDLSKTFLIKKEGNSDKGLKRNRTESSINNSNIVKTFKRRARTDESQKFDITQFTFKKEPKANLSEDESENEDKQRDSNLDLFLEMACHLKSEKKENVVELITEDNLNKTDEADCSAVTVITDESIKRTKLRKITKVKTSLDDIKKLIKLESSNDLKNNNKVRFRSEIAPESNEIAEQELQKQISKTDFANMAIVGQFNLGFIIAKLNSDLFIIDQHATDEKYNFEQLQLNTVLEKQVLVNPKSLELTAGNESVLIENEQIFNKNGFTFKIDHEAPATKKVFLTSIPVSKSYAFGKEDIDEMLFMLQDASNTMCRPSRVRAMFASRACRKSVMIGKALSKSDMRKLIDHMGEIDQPWNCPHGRPTMRHLINLDLIHDTDA